MAQIELKPVQSSMINAVGYDSDSRTLRVEFNNGSVYDYYDVPAPEYNDLRNAESVGKYFTANIKKIYNYAQQS